ESTGGGGGGRVWGGAEKTSGPVLAVTRAVRGLPRKGDHRPKHSIFPRRPPPLLSQKHKRRDSPLSSPKNRCKRWGNRNLSSRAHRRWFEHPGEDRGGIRWPRRRCVLHKCRDGTGCIGRRQHRIREVAA